MKKDQVIEISQEEALEAVGVDTKDLEEEVKELRGQYLEIEEKLKELGKTTKRVQTFVSKLKDNR